MSLTLVAALAAAPSALPACAWDRPGHNAFMGDVVGAVDRYQDIPAATRAKLKARMAARQYDEIVSIRRDSIQGQARYGSEIRDMHFGAGQTCGTVSRAAWSPDLQERGLVYCEDGQCILVPTVCRNVSRIQRTGPPTGPALAGTGPTGGAGGGGGGGGGGGAGSGDDPGAAAPRVPGGSAAAVPGGYAAPIPAAGLGGLPAGQNAPGSFASSAGLGLPGGAAGAGPAGGVGPAGPGVADGASAAGGTPGTGGQAPRNEGNGSVGGAPPLWASIGVGGLLAGQIGNNTVVGSNEGSFASGASGSGGAPGPAGGSGSAGSAGLPGAVPGLGSGGSGTGDSVLGISQGNGSNGDPATNSGSAGSGSGSGENSGSNSGSNSGPNSGSGSGSILGPGPGKGQIIADGTPGASDGILDDGLTEVNIPNLFAPAPAPPALIAGPDLGDLTAAIPEAQTGWMMALGAALVLVWRRHSARSTRPSRTAAQRRT